MTGVNEKSADTLSWLWRLSDSVMYYWEHDQSMVVSMAIGLGSFFFAFVFYSWNGQLLQGHDYRLQLKIGILLATMSTGSSLCLQPLLAGNYGHSSHTTTYAPVPIVMPFPCPDMATGCEVTPRFVSGVLLDLHSHLSETHSQTEMLRSSSITGFPRIKNALTTEAKALGEAIVVAELFRHAQQKEEGTVKLLMRRAAQLEAERRWAKDMPVEVAIRKLGSAPVTASQILCELSTSILAASSPSPGGVSSMDLLIQLGQKLREVEGLTNTTAGVASDAWYKTSIGGVQNLMYFVVHGQDMKAWDALDETRIGVGRTFFDRQQKQSHQAGERHQAWNMYMAAVQDSVARIQSVSDATCRVHAQEKEGSQNDAREHWRIAEDEEGVVVAEKAADLRGQIIDQRSTLDMLAFLGQVYQRPSEAHTPTPGGRGQKADNDRRGGT
jgi:hypothetical protein